MLSSSSSVWVDRMREPRFSLPNIPVKDCPRVRVLWLPRLCHTQAPACGEQSATGGDSLWLSSGFTPFKAAECGSALSKRQGSLGRCRTGESRGVAGRGWMCVWGRCGGVGSQGTSAVSWEAASAFASLLSFHMWIFLPHSWPWVWLRSWSAGGIIRVRFSIKM